MCISVFLDKLFNKMKKSHRQRVILRRTKNKMSKNFSVLGPIYCFNTNVILGNNVTLYPGVSFQGQGKIYIGDNTFIGNNTIIYSEKGYSIHIGNNVMIAGQCYIINTDHNINCNNQPMITNGTISSNIIVEDDVWIAGNVSVLKGSHIKRGCVIGAKALVNTTTDENGVYVGIPAKKIKTRE